MKRLCSISLDLDNLWSYLRVHGDPSWQSFPSYFDVFVPRYLDFMAARGLKSTVFVVGQDAVIEENVRWLKAIAEAGHEICNHSFRHEPWLHLYPPAEVEAEIAAAEEAITQATGAVPKGFRGPGYSTSPEVLACLARRGYHYDASSLPTFIGPLARAYYLRTADMDPEERQQRERLFGSFWDGFRPLRAHVVGQNGAEMVEIPVTTMPIFRTPFHFSYLIFLAEKSPSLASHYLGMALRLCRLTRTEPSLLLHPLDFLGPEDATELAFFPGMRIDAETKMAWLDRFLGQVEQRFSLVPMAQHAESVMAGRSHLA